MLRTPEWKISSIIKQRKLCCALYKANVLNVNITEQSDIFILAWLLIVYH